MERLPLDTGWECATALGHFMRPPDAWQPVTLPHDAAASKLLDQGNPTGPAGGYAWSGQVVYRKWLDVPDVWAGRRVILEFEGVYMNATVTVNGNVAALHPYGYTSFLVDVTPYLVPGQRNEIVVRANNDAQPNSRWYTGTGIYRHVWLRVGAGVHIPPWGVSVTTPEVDPRVSLVAVSTELANTTAADVEVVLRTTVLDDAGEVVCSGEDAVQIAAGDTAVVSQELMVTEAKLWSVDTPHLYRVTSEVLEGSEVVDAETTSLGIRSIALDSKNGFRLNGEALKLRGGCVHHDHGLLGAASYDRAEERKVELLKASGFNAIRSAHNPPAPALLDACDRLGMLVIDESFDCWRMGKNPHDYHLFFEDWWQRDTESMVRRDRNHPSVAMWSIGNEIPERAGASDGYAWCRRQADYVRSLDGSRPVTAAVAALFEEDLTEHDLDGELPDDMFEALNCAPTGPGDDRWGEVTAPFFASLDVGGYNYINNRYAYDQEHYIDRVICGTETHPQRAFEYWTLTERLPNVIGDFVWTAIDYLGESGIGRVTFGDSAVPFFAADPWPWRVAGCGDLDICGFKRPQSHFRDILWGVRHEPYIGVLDPSHHGERISFSPWGWEPVSDTWTFPGQEGKPTRVEVYSADEEVELVLNGVSLGRKPAGASQKNKAVFEVTYEPGVISAIGFTGGKETGRMVLRTASEPVALRLTPDRMGIRDRGDLVYLTVEAVDYAGTVAKAADREVSIKVSGEGELIALGTADPYAGSCPVGKTCRIFEGRALAIVRSTESEGSILVQASSPGLATAEALVDVQR